MKQNKKESKIKDLALEIISVIAIILIFTAIDYYIHSLSKEYSVPSYYFKNKIIFGSLIGFAAYFFIKNKQLLTKSIIFSAVISILLQTRYYLEGYPKKFVFEFLIFHFLILLPISLMIFKILKK